MSQNISEIGTGFDNCVTRRLSAANLLFNSFSQNYIVGYSQIGLEHRIPYRRVEIGEVFAKPRADCCHRESEPRNFLLGIRGGLLAHCFGKRHGANSDHFAASDARADWGSNTASYASCL